MTKKIQAELESALARMLDRMDGYLRECGYHGPPVDMYIAGGIAVNYYCGSRYTEDIDASFSRRLMLPFHELTVDYTRTDGTPSFIYFDTQYNDTFALLHEDYRQDCVVWEGFDNAKRIIQVKVLSPLDLAVSKVARYSSQDREDILLLAEHGLFTVDAFEVRCREAMGFFVGDLRKIETSAFLLARDMRALRETHDDGSAR